MSKPVASVSREIEISWALLRLPIILFLAYFFRGTILNLIERKWEIVGVTLLAIDVAGTPVSRVILAALLSGSLFLIWKIGSRNAGVIGNVLSVLLGAVLIWSIVLASGTPRRWALLFSIVLALNWFSGKTLLCMKVPSEWIDALIRFVPGVGELLFSSRYLGWVLSLIGIQEGRKLTVSSSGAPGALVVSVGLMLFVNGTKLIGYEQALRNPAVVKVVAAGDFNGIRLSADKAHLYAAGHGQNNLKMFDVLSWDAIQSDVSINGAQSLGLNEADGEVFVYDTANLKVVSLSSSNLSFKREFSVEGLSPGDPWIGIESSSDSLILSSEADERIGSPLIVLDRSTGALRFRGDQEAGNILIDQRSHLLYLSFFRRMSGVLAIDVITGSVVARTEADERVDRMALDAKRNELLVASTMKSRIQRFDAQTLAAKGAYPAIAGVRVIAVDPVRDMMLVGSLVTGKVAAISLVDGELVKSWYLGPWLRTIEVDVDKGLAYVSSNGFLYRLDYGASLKAVL